jgi:hypothetical protein
MHRLILLTAAASFIAACNCGAPRECDPAKPDDCGADLACEPVTGRDKPLCVSPVQIEGRVFDLISNAGIEKAEVTAVDANGSPVGAFAVSGTDGKYVLRVPSQRSDEKGTFVGKPVTLRASAANYATFPSGIRISLPLDTTAAARETQDDPTKPYVLKSTQTDVGLNPLADADKGRPSIIGSVEVATGQRGVLIVAESGAPPAITTIADAKGAFHIFNVAPGTYKVQAYSAGSNYTPVDVTVAAGTDSKDVSIKKAGAAAAKVSGSVSLVAGANNAGTSVVLVVESTFKEVKDPYVKFARGEVPPGLRAPSPGTAPNVSGAWSIDGVPDGKYVILAGFENDGNVRDPDPNISGTSTVHITVAAGAVQGTFDAFKVTGAIAMNGPGAADGPAELTSATPTFSWKAYSSTKSYDLTVFDGFGTPLWTKNAIPAVTGGNNEVVYAGPALKVGLVYQWRVAALGNAGNPLSQTEDLRGLFQVKP